jgi:hypothetical protein
MNLNLTHLVILILFTTSLVKRSQMNGIYMHLQGKLLCGYMANGQIGIVTDDTP